MLNHVIASIKEMGVPEQYSTETMVQLAHKASAKCPSQRTNRRDVLKIGSFDNVVIHDAMIAHFAYLALYHPDLINDKSWGPSLTPLLHLIDGVRHLGIPDVSVTSILKKYQGGKPAAKGSQYDPENDSETVDSDLALFNSATD